MERDRNVARNEPGPHAGGGPSTGFVFFEKVPDLKFSFRKRMLHKGAAIGYHLQKTDEVYYILSGTGAMKINDSQLDVKAGDAILTRGGSSHGLRQTGRGDLTIIITYQKE
jgi:mannose-6-phosphate isomerase-like protein (cupin superfamily)